MAKEQEGLIYETGGTAEQEHRPQAYCDRQGPGYDNDVSLAGWLRNGKAEGKPGYDPTGKATRSKV